MNKELEVAIKAAKEGGKIIKKYYKKKIQIFTKYDKSPVTMVDRICEKKIISIIKKNFPNHNLFGEEFSYQKTNSEYKWIVDPVDGTNQFIRGLPYFGTSIGLEKNGRIILGVMNLPILNILAYAVYGKGTFLNGKRIKVSNVKKTEDAYLIFGDVNRIFDFGYGNHFLELIRVCRAHRGYGDLIGFLFLAQGYVDVFVDTNKPWDIAAAKIIIEEAGGKITDFNGKDTIYSGNCIATNGKLHSKVVKIFNKK